MIILKNTHFSTLSLKRSSLALALVLFLVTSLNAQNSLQPQFYHLNTQNGLSQNSVYDIAQDSNGFMWFATEFGLNRYNGYTFNHFLHNPNDSGSLSNNFINCLYTSIEGQLWVGTNGSGLSQYNAQSETFLNYPYPNDPDSFFEHNSIWSIEENNEGNLWVGTFGGGLKQFNPKTKQWTSFEHPKIKDVRTIVAEPNGDLWIGTFGNGVYKWSQKTAAFEPLFEYAKFNLPEKVLCLKKIGVELWIGTQKAGLFCFDTQSKRLINYVHSSENENSISGNFARDIQPDVHRKNILWISIWGKGLCSFNTETKQWNRFRPNPDLKTSLADNTPLKLFTDANGLSWVGTYKSGVTRFNTKKQAFEAIYDLEQNTTKASSKFIQGITKIGKQVWVSNGSKGLQRVQGQHLVTKHVLFDKDWLLALSQPRLEPIGGLYSILYQGDSVLWLGTINKGLIQYDLKTEKTKKVVLGDEFGVYKTGIYTSLLDSKNNLWFGSYGDGLFKMDAKTQRVTRFANKSKDASSLSNNTITALYEDSEGNIWVGTGTGGVSLYISETNHFKRFTSLNEPGASISITSIDQSGDETVWIASTTGLYKAIQKNGRWIFTHFTTKNGLPTDRVMAILCDKSNNPWISTGQGIYQLKLNEFTGKFEYIQYDETNGLHSLDFANGSKFKEANGRFYFGGIGGLTRFYPDSFMADESAPQIVFTDLQIMNEAVELKFNPNENGIFKKGNNYYSTKPIHQLQCLSLTYAEKLFTISFAALNYAHPPKNRFKYRLIGFDTAWVNAQNWHEVSYTNLPAGEYSFEVIACNGSGNWTKQPKKLKIVIIPPFWETWWFISSGSVAITLVIGLVIWLRFNRLKKAKTQLEKTVAERTHEIAQKATELATANQQLVAMGKFKETLTRMLVHDLKNPLNGIVHLSTKTKNQDVGIEQAARKMLSLVMNILDVQQLQEQRLQPNLRSVAINNVLDNALKYVQLSTSQKNIEIRVVGNQNLLAICDANLIERVLINLLTNAIQFSPNNGLVVVRLKTFENKLKVTIKDSGHGMSAEQIERINSNSVELTRAQNSYSTGIGLQFCQLALKAHTSNLIITSDLEDDMVGAEVSFELNASTDEDVNQNTNTIKPGDNSADFELALSEVAELKHVAKQLAGLEVFEGSKILTELEQVNSSSIGVTNWIAAIKNSVFSTNKEAYKTLIDRILEHE